MGFNAVRPSNLPHHWPTVVEDFMALAEAYNLKVILDPGEGHNLMKYSYQDLQANRTSWKNYLKTRVTDRFKNYSSLLGYAVIDEPSLYQCFDLNGNPVYVSKSEKLARWNLIVELLDELDPAHADYTVFTSPSWLETAVNTYNRKGICYDNYPFEDQVPYYVMGPANEYGWYTRYQAFNNACQSQYHVPQVSVIQSFSEGYSPWRFPKAEELRTCVYTSLAAGAKGVVFFLYIDTLYGDIRDKYGLVDVNYIPNDTTLYNEAKDLVAKLGTLGPTIMTLTSTTGGAITGWPSSSGILKSSYQNSSGVKYHIVANKDPNPGHSSITYSLALSGSNYYVTDVYSGETFSANANGNASIPLAPAHGRVLQESINKSITVTLPTASTDWVQGTTNQIRWSSSGITGYVAIRLYKKNSSTYYTVDNSHPYNGSPKYYKVPTSVPAGDYYIKVFQGSVYGKSANFTVSEPATPGICTSVSTLSFIGNKGDTLTGTFKVRNCGDGTLSYNISDNKSWMSLSSTSGTSTGEWDTITVTVQTVSLSYGTNYSGTITVSGSGVSSKTISVSLRVRYKKYVFYRYLNSTIGDHYYTTNYNELGAGAGGYVYEGPACKVYKQKEPGTVPLYRYLNSSRGDHFYTANYNELGGGAFGYILEGVACYVYTSPLEPGGKTFYRYDNDNIGDHYYTVNYNELGSGAGGYVYEGPACIVF